MNLKRDRHPPSTPQPSSIPDVGWLGETLVQQWLQAQGWQVLHSRWRCRWGEIDLIACPEPSVPCHRENELVFVEVKTRRLQNWDAGGLLAITPQKQRKLIQTAQLFLAKNPSLAELPCRFDVALVSCRVLQKNSQLQQCNDSLSAIELGNPVYFKGYELTLHHYLESAFDSE